VSINQTAIKTVSFSRGAPSLDIIDSEGLTESANNALTSDPAGVFSYGNAFGYEPLREWLAENYSVDTKQVMVTNGSMQADAFLFDLTVKQGDVVITERPTYDRTLLSLRKRGADVHAIPLEEDGIDVDAVEALLNKGVRPKLAHIIPNYQNPAGVTLSLKKREKLLELASEYGFTIFEDDPYRDLSFSGEALPSMFSLDQNNCVVYVSSFTKTVCPGVRVGFILAPERFTARAAQLATNTYISPSMVSQAIVNDFCRSGKLERSIETVKAALKERSAVLADELAKQIPAAKFRRPEGGYFMWVDLPEGTDISALADSAEAKGAVFVKGSDFLLEDSSNSLRLAFSAVGVEGIREGVTRIAAAAKEQGL